MNLIIVSILGEYALIGIIAGLIACRPKVSLLSAYISPIISAVLMLPDPIQVLIIATTLGIWSGIMGYLSGRYFDSRSLIYVPKK